MNCLIVLVFGLTIHAVLAEENLCNVGDDNGIIYGICEEDELPPGVSENDGPDDSAVHAGEVKLATIPDDTSEKPEEPRALAQPTDSESSFGTSGEPCDSNCKWVKPKRVYDRTLGWVRVLQTESRQQWISVCKCKDKLCSGYMYYSYYWWAQCKPQYIYHTLYVMVRDRVTGSYGLQQRWFRLPTACSCGNPYMLYQYTGEDEDSAVFFGGRK